MSINLRLDEELHADLKQLADEEERSIANLIRRMLTFRIALIALIIEARALDAYVRNSSL